MRYSIVLLFLMLSLASNVSAQRAVFDPCSDYRIHCFALDGDGLPSAGALPGAVANMRVARMDVRAWHGGIMAHAWVELQTSRGTVTIGYGPASIPFIDAGQISVWD